MTNPQALTILRLSIQRALLGVVTCSWIAVTCGLRERTIQIRVYLEGDITPADTEIVQRVGAEVIADFPDGFLIEESCVSASASAPLEMLDFWAFLRRDTPV